MITFLLFVTVLSLTAAVASILTVRNMKLADERRSNARVAALVAAADTAGGHTGMRGSAGGGHPYTPEPPDTQPDGVGVDTLFGAVRRTPPASGHFAIAAGLALLVALVGAAIAFTATSDRTATVAPRPAHATSLDLVSLGHSRRAKMLTISGVVRNPPDGLRLDGLTAVVSLIGGRGEVISTKDVPLDYRALGPGEEAPFRVTVQDAGSIARYRVSFRAGTEVVSHVDRRRDAGLAGTS